MSATQVQKFSLPNKYRPRRFQDMKHQAFAAGVGKALGEGRRMQGYIIEGPMGCGKTTLARIIAASLNAASGLDDNGDPCDPRDPQALAVHMGNHPEVKEINAADKRGIDQIRDIITDAHTGVPRGVRVYIIDEAHRLTPDAFIALLKPIEEPPEDVVFILCTTDVQHIPETIISRLPRIPIKPFSAPQLTECVTEVLERWNADDDSITINNPREVAESVARYAMGSLRTAMTMAENVILHGVNEYPSNSDIDLVVSSSVRGDTKTAVAALRSLCEQGFDERTIVRGVQYSLTEAVLGDTTRITISETDWERVTLLLKILDESEKASNPLAHFISGLGSLSIMVGLSGERQRRIEAMLHQIIAQKG